MPSNGNYTQCNNTSSVDTSTSVEIDQETRENVYMEGITLSDRVGGETNEDTSTLSPINEEHYFTTCDKPGIVPGHDRGTPTHVHGVEDPFDVYNVDIDTVLDDDGVYRGPSGIEYKLEHRHNCTEFVYEEEFTSSQINFFIEAVRSGFRPRRDICLCMDQSYPHRNEMLCFETHTGTRLDPAVGQKEKPRPGQYVHAHNQLLAKAADPECRSTFKEGTIPAWAVHVYNKVSESGVPNMMGACIILPSTLMFLQWEKIMTGHPDERWLLAGMKYGFPLQYTGEALNNRNIRNHSSAIMSKKHITKFVTSEKDAGALIGPINKSDVEPNLSCSPIMTRDKSDPDEKRVIVDLSWPVDKSFNSKIYKNTLFGWKIQHKLPTLQHAVQIIKRKGFKVLLAALDIRKCYRNYRSCPQTWHFMGISHLGETMLDIGLPFGTRASSMFVQKIAIWITRYLSKMGIHTVFYLDDLLLVYDQDMDAVKSFKEVMHLVVTLGLPINVKKICNPAQSLIWLGFHIDVGSKTVSIPLPKISSTCDVIKDLRHRKTTDLRSLQRLVGKANHISQIIPSTRLFINKLLEGMRGAKVGDRIKISKGMQEDMDWMSRFLHEINTRSMMEKPEITEVIEADSCLLGGGGFDGKHFYSITYTSTMTKAYHISQFEALNCMFALRALGKKYPPKSHIEIRCDNIATIWTFAGYKARDKVMLAAARAIWFLANEKQWILSFTHVPGVDMVLSDGLSRESLGEGYEKIVIAETKKRCISRIFPDFKLFDFSSFM